MRFWTSGMTNSSIKLICDGREDKGRLENLRVSFEDIAVPLEIKNIPVGDYVGCIDDVPVFAVEYKTYHDLCLSISNGHLTQQVFDMKQYNCPTFLFVEGTYESYVKKMKSHKRRACPREVVTGYLLSVSFQTPVKVLMYNNEAECFAALKHMLKTALYPSEGTFGHEVVLPERHKRTGDPSLDMMLALPGIGKKKALALRDTMTFSQLMSRCKTDSNIPRIVPKQTVEFLKHL